MKITYLLKYFPVFGGGETVTIALANEMVARGHEVSIAYFEPRGREVLPFVSPAIRQFRLPAPRDFAATTNIAALRASCLAFKTEVVVNQWGEDLSPMCRKALEGLGVPLVVCLHVPPYIRNPLIGWGPADLLRRIGYPVFRWIERRNSMARKARVLALCDRYVFLSERFVEQFRVMAPRLWDPAKIRAIPNPLPFPEFAAAEDLDRKEPILLFVGRISEHHKRVGLLLSAWRILCADPALSAWKLQIVGDGPDLPALRERARRGKLERVEFLGQRDPLEFYRRASLFAMTSAFEGFGMTLVEAQQNGAVPVVMDSFLSLRDIVDDRGNGRIAPDGDVAAFADALRESMLDKKCREAMACAGLESCRRFAVGRVVDRWEELFRDLGVGRAEPPDPAIGIHP